MTTKHLLGLTLVLMLISMPMVTLAQDDGPELEEYVSEDELLTAIVPVGWFQPDASDFPFPAIFLLNSEEAAADPNADAMPGVRGVFVVILPLQALAMFGGSVPEAETLTELADFVVGMFNAPDEDATEEEIAAISNSEAEEVELAEGVIAASVESSTLYEDGVYFVRQLGDDLVGLVYTAAYKGEFDDAQLELGRQAAATLSYEGTAADLMAALMAPPEFEESAVDPATLDGDALVDERCTVCHTRERIDAAEKDLEGWTATVDRMIGHGAQLDSAERLAVIHFLAGVPLEEGDSAMGGVLDGETLVADRCLVCHSSYRINQANLDDVGWTHAVDMMIIYGAELTVDERQVVIDYLVSLEADTPAVTMGGAELVVDRCLNCHTEQRINNSDKDEAGWTATVDRMLINGAELTKEERQIVIDYLVATH